MNWFVPEQAKVKKQKVREYQNTISNFIRIFKYSKLSDRIWLTAAGVSSVATGVTIPLMNVIFAKLIRVFTAFYSSWYTGFTPDQFREEVNKYVLYMVYLFVARLFLDYVGILGFRFTSVRISAAMRLAYMRTLLALPISTVDAIPPGATASLITITANHVQAGVSESLSILIQTISLIITAVVVAFVFSWLLTLVTLGGLVFVVCVYSITIHYLVKRWKKVEESDKLGAAVANEAFSSIRMVAACGAESKIGKKYFDWAEESARRGLQMSPFVALQYAPVFFAIYATFALCFWYAIQLYMSSRITSVESLLVVITSVLTVVMSVGSIAMPAAAFSRASAAATLFYTIIDAETTKIGGLKEPDITAENDIVLQRVNFTYPARFDCRALSNVTVTFPAGKTTAIVGPSGSGKSTIVALIQRWYELDGSSTENATTMYFRQGTITTEGRNLNEIDLKWWRSQIGLVQQEPFLFNDTIYQNVEYGLIGTAWEDETEDAKRELVVDACKEAFADDFISQLPDGYNTQCGDAGIKLSGGQRQRIAIARSIVKKPKILILDEATSAMDVRGEQKVQAALERASQNRTTIVIAHRLSTIQKADNIVVLQRGTVVQQGSHTKLMKNRAGVYHRLVHSQQLSSASDTTNYGLLDLPDFDKKVEQLSFSTGSDIRDPDEQSRTRKEPRHPKGILSNLGRTLSEQRQDWYWYTLLFLCSVGAGAAYPLQAYIFARLISLFSFFGDYLRDQTNFWCLMTVVLAIGVGISYFILGWAANTVSFHIIRSYRKEYFNNLLQKPISFFDEEENSVGALSARIASDPAQLQQLLGINLASILSCIFNVVGCIIISFCFSWRLAVVVVFSSMPIIIAAGYLKMRFEMRFEKLNFKIFSESSKFATEAIGAYRTVSALTLEDHICQKYESLLQTHVDEAFGKAKWTTWIFSFSDSVALLCMAFALWYGGRLLSQYDVYPFNYLVVYLAVVQGSLGAGQWLSFGPNIAQATAAANRIHALRTQDNTESQVGADHVDAEKNRKGAKLELRDVWFKYPTREGSVLQGLNLTIEEGQFAAIVGASGCGKTSIINLLERFYDLESGQILYEDKDIATIPLAQYRKNLSLVAQEPSIFDGTVRENILFGVPDPSSISQEALDAVCKDAEIYDFIYSLHSLFDTYVGTKGVALSGGQKQRIAIARALIRNPRVLLLDEATSNLDSETEKSIQDVFERTAKGRTMVVVAHRLATVQNADVIFVVADGQVLERGNHRTLLRKKGVYWQMCQMQTLNK